MQPKTLRFATLEEFFRFVNHLSDQTEDYVQIFRHKHEDAVYYNAVVPNGFFIYSITVRGTDQVKQADEGLKTFKVFNAQLVED